MTPIASALRLTFTESHTFRTASTVPGYLAPGMAHFFRDGKFDSFLLVFQPPPGLAHMGVGGAPVSWLVCVHTTPRQQAHGY